MVVFEALYTVQVLLRIDLAVLAITSFFFYLLNLRDISNVLELREI